MLKIKICYIKFIFLKCCLNVNSLCQEYILGRFLPDLRSNTQSIQIIFVFETKIQISVICISICTNKCVICIQILFLFIQYDKSIWKFMDTYWYSQKKYSYTK